jgi:endonuclease/exonuclease/phosphatase family metal-dependent hydrolase
MRKLTKVILILTNLIASLALILGCYGNHINEGDYWFMGLFSLAAFYLLIVVLCFFVFWLFVKPVVTIISILTLFFCWSPLHHVFQIRSEQPFSISKTKDNFRVMTWNVELFNILEHKTHPEKKMQMIELINQYNPDVACFQEVVASDSSRHAINSIAELLQKLKMKYYYFTYNPKLDFDNDHRFGILIFSKYPIINKQTIKLEPFNYNSIFQYVDIVKEEDTFRIFNIHLQSLRFTQENRQYLNDPSISTEKDIQESKNILQKFKKGFINRHWQSDHVKKEMGKSPYHIIVCGDFNDVPNSYAYINIGENLVNTFYKKGAGISNTFDGISPTLRIDNIFVDKKFSIEQYTRVKRKLSDHFPVITDLRLGK